MEVATGGDPGGVSVENDHEFPSTGALSFAGFAGFGRGFLGAAGAFGSASGVALRFSSTCSFTASRRVWARDCPAPLKATKHSAKKTQRSLITYRLYAQNGPLRQCRGTGLSIIMTQSIIVAVQGLALARAGSNVGIATSVSWTSVTIAANISGSVRTASPRIALLYRLRHSRS